MKTSRKKTRKTQRTPGPPGKRQMVTLDQETLDRVVSFARRQGRSISGMMTYALRCYFSTLPPD